MGNKSGKVKKKSDSEDEGTNVNGDAGKTESNQESGEEKTQEVSSYPLTGCKSYSY